MPDLDTLDDILLKISQFKFRPHACPACGQKLVAPIPLRHACCPVCRNGKVVKRDFTLDKCPICRAGFLAAVSNIRPIKYCPVCQFGHLVKHTYGISKRSTCDSCNATFRKVKSYLMLEKFGKVTSDILQEGETKTESEWIEISLRTERVLECETCCAQFDCLQNGKLKLVHINDDPFGIGSAHTILLPEEWSRISHRLDLDSGNAECNTCGADYFIEGESITLLNADHDPFNFANHFQGRKWSMDAVRWVGAGKNSGNEGVICEGCATEFDYSGDYLRLHASEHPLIKQYIGRAFPLEDWHRLSQSLPTIDEEYRIREEIHSVIFNGILNQEIQLYDTQPDTIWESECTVIDDSDQHFPGVFRITTNTLQLISDHSWTAPYDALRDVDRDGDMIILHLIGQCRTQLLIQPQDIEVPMVSGVYQIRINANDIHILVQSLMHSKIKLNYDK